MEERVVGQLLGNDEGINVGIKDGVEEGTGIGITDGAIDGQDEGRADGVNEGLNEGKADAVNDVIRVGLFDSTTDGMFDGDLVGENVDIVIGIEDNDVGPTVDVEEGVELPIYAPVDEL